MKVSSSHILFIVTGLLALSACAGDKGNKNLRVSASEKDTPVEEMRSEEVALADFDSISDSSSAPNAIIHYGSIAITKRVVGEGATDFWQNGLTELTYSLYKNDSLLIELDIEPSDFKHLYVKDFSERARIWSSEILAVDSLREKIVISTRFGLPESDNETYVLCIADFRGHKVYMDSPFASASGTNVSFNMIVNCNGVYDFDQPVLEFNSCCTVYADLVNAKTLFYVIDWEKNSDIDKENAFLIDIFSKDTLDRFRFDGFSYELGYTALIAQDKAMGILALFDPENKKLTRWDSLLNKEVYEVTTLRTVPDLQPGDRTIEIYSYPAGRILFEFDDELRPVSWNQ